MPWRRTHDPYRIVVSEIMLQQTQVSRVLRFYPAFIKKFPNFRALARAKTGDVLRAWAGMGYNRRAVALQNLSRIVLRNYNGKLPHERELLESLPGIGKATAGSVRVFTWNEHDVFIETNIRRVFIHFFFPGRKKVTDTEIERYIKRTIPAKNFREWYWALMDYGSMLGVAERGMQNPNRRSAHYMKQARFEGSDRELRGKILKLLLKKGNITQGEIVRNTGTSLARVRKVASILVREGFARQNGNVLHEIS